MSDEKTITIKKSDLWRYSTFLLIAVVLIGGIFLFTGNGSPTQVPTNPTQQQGKVSASIDDDAILGDPNAPITIIEFSDYQCPFCGRFWSQTLPLIKSEYIDTGKVKLVYRDFPLDSIHPFATPAAEAAECVRDEAGGSDETYFEYHDKIFANQASLSESNLKQWAQELGYNIDSCLSSGKFASEVRKDLADAQSAGGRGTPFFVIIGSDGKGTPLSGAQPFSAFKQILDSI
ncbi:MAG: DsbA family protein [Nanoarchaeota archaeon]|nr:DsbA family protein [Nanoarchaeota archaeon]